MSTNKKDTTNEPKRKFLLVKYIVGAVFVEEIDGVIIREIPIDPVPCYGEEQLERHIAAINDVPNNPPPSLDLL